MCYVHYFDFQLSRQQCGEFLELWMASHGFGEFPNLIEYYTTTGNDTLLKEWYNTIETVHYLQMLTI